MKWISKLLGRPALHKWLGRKAGLYDPSVGEAIELSELHSKAGIKKAKGEPEIAKAWDRAAVHYNRILGFTLPSANANYILDTVKFRKNYNVLSIGSGTGGIETFLARHEVPEGRVVGIDVSGEMCRQASALAKKTGVKNATFIRATSRALPVASNSQNVVISVYFHEASWPHFLKNLKESERAIVKSPQSRFVMVTGCNDEKDAQKYASSIERAGFKVLNLKNKRYGGTMVAFIAASPAPQK